MRYHGDLCQDDRVIGSWSAVEVDHIGSRRFDCHLTFRNRGMRFFVQSPAGTHLDVLSRVLARALRSGFLEAEQEDVLSDPPAGEGGPRAGAGRFPV